MLLHAQRLWPEYISTMLWPFALLAAGDGINNMHVDIDGLTPDIKFSQVTGPAVRLQNYHTFGCPVYVLWQDLEAQGTPLCAWWHADFWRQLLRDIGPYCQLD